jgi:acetylornithine deacetylase/succinyl-diaminopimelate desuccinylase-like protein
VVVTDAALETHLVATREGRYDSFRDFLRLPSISALPEHQGDIRQTAAWLADALTRAGLEHAEVSETAGNPVVYADWLHAPGAPTVLVYGHYDVQPVDPLDLWTSPPFDPVIVDGRLLARGVADDKGHIHGHLMAAAAVLATRGSLPLNVKYIFEGEEEVSSPNLAAWLTSNRERLAADVVIISDTGFFEGNLPAITIGLRGMVYSQIDVTGTPVDVHSGGFGGVIENPANALAQIIAALKGPDGRVRIPGFYDDVVPLTEPERAALAELPFDEEAFRERTGVPALVGESGFSVLERKGARPTLDVNGIWGGFTGEGSKTIIPAHAHAKVSCRLVTAQDPDRTFEQLRDYVDEIAPPGVKVSVRLLGKGQPSLTPQDHPATQAAARAIEATFGRPPLYLREGGSIPICASFESILGLPVVMVGFSQPDDHAHAPNEWLDLDNYETGIRMFARLWDELAGLRPGV